MNWLFRIPILGWILSLVVGVIRFVLSLVFGGFLGGGRTSNPYGGRPDGGIFNNNPFGGTSSRGFRESPNQNRGLPTIGNDKRGGGGARFR